MKKNQYVIIFYKSVIGGFPQEAGIRKVIDDSNLKEGKSTQKPPNCFRYKGGLYLFQKDSYTSFDEKGRPIYKYILGNAIVNGNLAKQFVIDGNGDLVYNPKTGLPEIDPDAEPLPIDAYLFDYAFSRGEMKSVIAGSQKPSTQWDFKTLIFGAVMGAGIAFMILALTGHLIGI